MNRIWTLMATCIILLVTESAAFAMTFMEPVKVMHTRYDVTTQRVRGTAFLKTEDLDGTELVFAVHDEGEFDKNYVSMESVDGETVYLTFPVGMWFQVKEIHTEDPERKLWLVQTGAGVRKGKCEVTSLVGRHGDTYVEYVTLEDLKETKIFGFGSWWTVEDGELVMRDWGRGYRQDEMRFFWDENAEWFGFRHNSSAINKLGDWFYTDENGANYYLQGLNKGHIWIYGDVIREDTDGEKVPLQYYVYTYQVQCPYTIYNAGEATERGCLYDGSDANPSAVAFFESTVYGKGGNNMRSPKPPRAPVVIEEPKTYEDVLNNTFNIAYSESKDRSAYEKYVGVKEAAYGIVPESRLSKIGYCIEDISGDGIPELIIAEIDHSRIVLLYTCVDGAPKFVLRGWGRNRYYLLDDGLLYHEGSSGAQYSTRSVSQLSEDGTSVKILEERTTYIKEGETTRFGIFHKSYDEDGNYTVEEMDEAKFEWWRRMREEYKNRAVELDLTPFSEYK